ncbi:hypothetical protein D3C81_358410 [compost metagenome]
MAIIQNTLKIEIYPTVQDVCEVISAVVAFYPGQEEKVLQAIRDATDKRIEEITKKDRPDETVKEIAKELGKLVAENKRTIPLTYQQPLEQA